MPQTKNQKQEKFVQSTFENQRNSVESVPSVIDDGTGHYPAFGKKVILQYPSGGKKPTHGKLIQGKLRFTSLCGAQGKHYFEFPSDLKEIMKNDVEQYEHRNLKSITCSMFDAISSIQLHFSDNVESPKFGNTTSRMLQCNLVVP